MTNTIEDAQKELTGNAVLHMINTKKIKLIKNSRGYSWEISNDNHDIDYLKKLNEKMDEVFGSGFE